MRDPGQSQRPFGMMKMFEVLAENFFRVTRTFRIATEAWLVSQQSLDQHNRKTGANSSRLFKHNGRDAVRSQVIDVLGAQEIKETGLIR